jgi:hypothetical protein
MDRFLSANITPPRIHKSFWNLMSVQIACYSLIKKLHLQDRALRRGRPSRLADHELGWGLNQLPREIGILHSRH